MTEKRPTASSSFGSLQFSLPDEFPTQSSATADEVRFCRTVESSNLRLRCCCGHDHIKDNESQIQGKEPPNPTAGANFGRRATGQRDRLRRNRCPAGVSGQDIPRRFF